MKVNLVFVIFLAIAMLGMGFKSQAINLGGTTVAKDHFVVYLGIGHCNMAGRNVSSADATTNPRCWNYHWQTDLQWVLAKEANGGDASGGTATGFSGLTQRGTGGPCMPFIKGLATSYPAYYIGIVENGISRGQVRYATAPNPTGVASGFVDTYWKGAGNLYSEIITAAKAVQPNVTIGGIICMLGYTESCYDASTTDAANMKANLVTMVTNLRADLGMPNLPFIINSFERGATGCFSPSYNSAASAIVKQIDSLPKALAYCDTVGNTGCTYRDDHHFDTPGENLWASRVVAKIVSKGWFPVATTAVSPRENNRAESFHVNISVQRMNSLKNRVIFSFEKVVNNPVITIYNCKGETVRGHAYYMGKQVRYNLDEKSGGFFIAKVSCDGMTAFKDLNMAP